MTGRSIALFAAAAIAEIGGAYLVWIAIREDKPDPTATTSRVPRFAWSA